MNGVDLGSGLILKGGSPGRLPSREAGSEGPRSAASSAAERKALQVHSALPPRTRPPERVQSCGKPWCLGRWAALFLNSRDPERRTRRGDARLLNGGLLMSELRLSPMSNDDDKLRRPARHGPERVYRPQRGGERSDPPSKAQVQRSSPSGRPSSASSIRWTWACGGDPLVSLEVVRSPSEGRSRSTRVSGGGSALPR